MEEYIVKIGDIIKYQCGLSDDYTIDGHTTLEQLHDDTRMDSLDQLIIIMELEEVFNISITDAEGEKLFMSNDIMNFSKKLGDLING